jgi:acyl carrier protein
MRERVQEIVRGAVAEAAAESGADALKAPGSQTPLFGGAGALDSMALVTLIADLEERLAEAFDTPVVLADERAMSRSRSPFRTVGALEDYICSLLPGAPAADS